MNASEFVEKLAKIAPTIEYLVSNGYEEIAEEIRNGYIINKKEKSDKAKYNDPLVHLICEYDVSTSFQIGMVKLGKHKYDFEAPINKIHVGAIESDILVIDPHTGCVELLDHAQPDFVMARCAVSGSAFLEAVLHLANFKPPYPDFRNLSQSQQIENNRAAKNCAVECSEIAGVEVEGSIYHTLLGYDSRIG